MQLCAPGLESKGISASYFCTPGGIEIVWQAMGMGRFSGSDVAIDLGTANTCIHTRGTVALSLPVVKADQRLATVVIGAGRLQSDQALLSKATVN